jgi:hypothetical protein
MVASWVPKYDVDSICVIEINKNGNGEGLFIPEMPADGFGTKLLARSVGLPALSSSSVI